jgi:hypothetical protein
MKNVLVAYLVASALVAVVEVWTLGPNSHLHRRKIHYDNYSRSSLVVVFLLRRVRVVVDVHHRIHQ